MPATKNKIRYITSGMATQDGRISDFDLLANNRLFNARTAIKVSIPDDLKLEKNDGFSTTRDTRTLSQLDAVPVAKVNGAWVEMPCLWQYGELRFWNEKLLQLGYVQTGRQNQKGYMTADQHRRWLERQKNQREKEAKQNAAQA